MSAIHFVQSSQIMGDEEPEAHCVEGAVSLQEKQADLVLGAVLNAEFFGEACGLYDDIEWHGKILGCLEATTKSVRAAISRESSEFGNQAAQSALDLRG
jgi:hypothetical protein